MAPKGKAKAQAKGKAKAQAKGKAKAQTKGKAAETPKPKAAARAEAKAAARDTAGGRAAAKARGAPSPADAPPKRSRTDQALEKAKAAAASGSSSGGARGRAVDSRVPNAANLKVFEDYAVKLNQTHIDANNNKYYIIQALQGDGKYFAWNRWGRVGEPGQNKLMPFSSPADAIKEFEKKFREKTCNNWAARDNFKPVNGKYTIVETEDAEGGGGQDQAPMGKLTQAQIGKGQNVLDKLDAVLKKGGDAKQLELISSEFYTLIPHNFGRARPLAITTDAMLQAKVELLKFYLRMGFEELEEDTGMTPVSGVMQLPVPTSLDNAANGLCSSSDIKKSATKGDDLAKKQAGRPTKNMTGHLYGSIMLYTSNAIYQDLNKCLRDENRTKLKKYFKYLRLFFESMDHLPKRNVKLWRGLSVDLHTNPQYKVGNTVTWWGISSCTADINVAQNFAKGCGGNCTVITLETTTASDISDITFYSNEKESLLSPGTQLQVTKNVKKGSVTEICLKEVGRALN